jgi:hypothetical protein
MAQQHFQKPDYAQHAFEVVRSLIIEVLWEDTTRWMRIEVLKDLLVNKYGPYSVRIFVRGKYETDPWAEPPEYPYWIGNSADEALEECLKGLAERAEIADGVERRERRQRG